MDSRQAKLQLTHGLVQPSAQMVISCANCEHYMLETGSGSEKGELNIFDAASFKWIKTLAKNADSLWYVYPAFSPDGQTLAASLGNHVTLWDTQTWKELASLPASGPTGLAFSPDGRILTTYTQSGKIQLWGVAGGH